MFHLHIKGSIDLSNWRKWDKETQCTFFHEYIHFLQDIMTSTGLYNIYVNGEYLSYATNYLYNQPKGMFNRPISSPPDINNVAYNIEMNKFVIAQISLPPNIDNINFKVTGKARTEDNFKNYNGQRINLIKVYIPFSDKGNRYEFKLGSYHISESMAYLAEQIMYGNPPMVPSPNYPYSIVEQLADCYVPQLSKNKQFLFALCDLALNFTHPAKVLIDYLVIVEEKGIQPQWEDTIEEFISNSVIETGDGKRISYIDGIKEIKDLAIDSMNRRFATIDHILLKKWIFAVIETTFEWRKDDPLILSKLISGGPLEENKVFNDFITLIGSPLLSNGKNETFFYNTADIKLSKRKLAHLLAAGSIIRIMKGFNDCLLYDYCKADNRCVNKVCQTKPWKKARFLCACPFGHLWYGWKLHGYFPKTN
ncbi:hypothetical protein D0T87_23180 [Bacteroides sp. 51]|nr:hypothetical protein [Bacteroides sp. 51]